jgi:mannose-6-phosphate isomerase-like protein (cupin superfamily)
MRVALALLCLLTVHAVSGTAAWAQVPAPTPAPTDRTKASVFPASDLAAALAKLSADRPSSAVRIFTLAPYNVNVERRLPKPQGASLHEAQAELFYVIEGSATLLTGGTLVASKRTGTNLAGTGIEGGTRQPFGKGDFLIVPSGLPHQFVDIQAPVHLMSIYLPNPQ